MKIKIENHSKIQGIKLLNFQDYIDFRGNFSRKFCANELKNLNFELKQVNLSTNLKKGTLRGIHYLKKPSLEKKIVICITGEIFDVLVDLRPNSKTFKKFTSINLNENKKKGVFIPQGIAHGFQTLKNNTNVIYFHSEFYNKKLDTGINPMDKFLNINWPIKKSIVSDKDKNLPNLI
tara:strand:+ start:111 stop:641 length:531 start_codon:yes stop_codon:yes gene_type:complete